jgi:hypothetical protein
MEDREIARLLSGRNEPSVLEKEAGFEAVMHAVDRGQRARRGWLWAGSLAAAAAALLLVFVRPGSEAGEEFTSRGGGGGQLGLLCVPPSPSRAPGAEEARCVAGGKLAFDVSGTENLYFAAFARRADGTVLWYWPAPTGRSLPVSAFADRRAPHTAVMLDASHPAGRYDVFGVFSRKPLGREELKRALGEDLRGDGTIQVVRRTFSVAPP